MYGQYCFISYNFYIISLRDATLSNFAKCLRLKHFLYFRVISHIIESLFFLFKNKENICLRGEERFKKLMERIKYEWENFKV